MKRALLFACVFIIFLGSFTFVSAVTVITPNGGETLREGNYYNITWSSDLPSGANTVIKILRGDDINGQGVGATDIQSQVSLFVTTNKGYYVWKVPNPADIKCGNRCTAPGNMFKVQIYYPQNDDFSGDMSDSYFTILDSQGNPQDVSFTCTEQGNVTDYYHQSSVVITKDSNSPYVDECVYDSRRDKTYLEKYSCGSNNDIQSVRFECPNGCSNGACVSAQKSCRDTDGGLNYNTKGNVTVCNFDSSNTCTAGSPDICVSNVDLRETSCNGDSIVFSTYTCPNGCRDGVCVQAQPQNLTCSETDGGYNIYVKGTTTSSTESVSYTDSCLDIRYLTEYSCGDGENKGYNIVNTVNCYNGCLDGICLINPSQYSYKLNITYSASNPSIVWADVGYDYLQLTSLTLNGKNYNVSIDLIGDNEVRLVVNNRTTPILSSGSQYKLYDNSVLTINSIMVFARGEHKQDYAVFSINVSSNSNSNVPSGSNGNSNNNVNNTNSGNGNSNYKNNTLICESGCALNNSCVSVGFIISKTYCSIDKAFVSQKTSGATCENNFECSSNVCAANKCVSQNLIQKIIAWFSRLFGG